MALTQPSLIPQPWGSDGQVGNIPQDSSEFGKASWAKGFPTETAQPLTEGGIPPSYLDFQGVLNALSAHAVFMQSGAHYAWSNTLDYPVGCFVLGSDGKLYQALQASGPGYSAGAKNPTSNAGYWSLVPLASDVAAAQAAAIATASADATSKASAAQAAAESTAAGLYLPLSGGKMLDTIFFYAVNGKNAIAADIDNGYIQICGGTTYGAGASVAVYGKDSANPGLYKVHASDGQTASDLLLYPDGRLLIRNSAVLTYSDSSVISVFGFPSTSKTELTLGASGTTYTAPKHGWFLFRKNGIPQGGYIALRNTSTGISVKTMQANATAQYLAVYVPVKNGESVSAEYSHAGSDTYFQFIENTGVV